MESFSGAQTLNVHIPLGCSIAPHKFMNGIEHIARLFGKTRATRAKEDNAGAEPFQIVESRDNARKIANTVATGVLKRPRIDLINNFALPPCRVIVSSIMTTSD
jgi:hypothetical protein